MKIDEIIELSTAFSAEVNVERDFQYDISGNDKYLDGYLPNRSSRKIIKSIFETLSTRDDRKLHLITASYGTGKSYLLLILAYLLGNKNLDFFTELKRKLADKDDYYDDGLTNTLNQYWGSNSKYLVVIPQYGTEDFEQGMLAALNHSLTKNNIDYVPLTNYIRAAEMLLSWSNDPEKHIFYDRFQELLPNKNGKDFIRLLQECDGTSYLKFKEIYKILFTDFSENHGDIYSAFQETAAHITKLGFKGIVTVYDEFGGVLEKLINRSELSSTTKIQDFLEYVKDKKESNANLIFIAASHQDPNTLNENKQQSINKLLGRFESYRLEVADNESEELLAEVFRKKDEISKNNLLNDGAVAGILDEVRSIGLYADRTDEWIVSKIIYCLYPLHPLTAYILPRLSNQFAQNSRTMFNFLSPNETSTGSLRTFLESTDVTDPFTEKIALFTPDLLLAYFRPNLVASSAVSSYVDAFDDAMGKVNDPVIKKLFENILILTVSRRNEVRPNFEVLLNAMQLVDRHAFKNLLDDLVHTDNLEHSPTGKIYEFPTAGTRSFGKVYEDEKKKLQDLSIYDCKPIWETVQPLEEYRFILHQEKFGANRSYACVAIFSSKELEAFWEQLRRIYSNELKDSTFQGFIIYMLIRDEELIEAFKTFLQTADKQLARYVIFAKPKDSDIFNKLLNHTIEFEAYFNTSNNIEIKSNPNHADKAKTSILKARSDLTNAVKQTYLPKNWNWSFDSLASWRDIDNPRVLETSMDSYIEQLFNDTIPVKDDALWFGRSSTVNVKARFSVITGILTAERRMIILFNGNNSGHDTRIQTNFFSSRIIAKETGTGSNIQYGEIIVPKTGTSWNMAWALIDDTLVVNGVITPDKFILPLLRSPYGLSEVIVKFIFACYVRFNADILIFTDPKSTFTIYDQSASVIDEMFKKPTNYGVRKIEMSDFAKRYVKALHSLFSTEGAINSFENVSRRFENLNFFTSLQLALIAKDTEVKKFYDRYLIPFVDSLKADRTNRENEAKEFFMDTLPPFIIPGITRELFENDNENAKAVVKKLKEYKAYPAQEETIFRLEVLRNLGSQVFGQQVATPEEFKHVVKAWFTQLSPNTKTAAQFENEKIKLWLGVLRNDNLADVFKFYLDELPLKPIKDWTDLYDDRSVFINNVRAYKEEIDNYKKSPIEIYHFIARSCFQISKAECPTEESFITLFQGWWDSVPTLNKEAVYENDLVNIFIHEFSSSASMSQRLLINTPIKWKDIGALKIFTNDWENWSADEVRSVAHIYSETIHAINSWEAPIPEKDFVNVLGQLFGKFGLDEFDKLRTAASEWYEKLPANTKSAKWSEGTAEEIFINAINSIDIRGFFIKMLPEQLQYKEFKYWNQTTMIEFGKSIDLIKTSVENYRRPVMEVINEVDKQLKTHSTTVAEFRANLKDSISVTEAYNSNAEDEEGYLTMPFAATLLKGLRTLNSDTVITGLIEKLAFELNIDEKYYLWLPETQTSFVKGFSVAVKYLKAWKFPEEQLLIKAKEKISAEIEVLQNDLQLSDVQLFKVLRDLISEKSAMKP